MLDENLIENFRKRVNENYFVLHFPASILYVTQTVEETHSVGTFGLLSLFFKAQ